MNKIYNKKVFPVFAALLVFISCSSTDEVKKVFVEPDYTIEDVKKEEQTSKEIEEQNNHIKELQEEIDLCNKYFIEEEILLISNVSIADIGICKWTKSSQLL